MDERKWEACNDPTLMLEHLGVKASDRRLRLLAAACCRGIWSLLTDQRSREAVEVAERYADGLVGDDELTAAGQAADSFARLAALESDVTSPFDLNLGALGLPHPRPIVDTFAGYAAYHVASLTPKWVSEAHGQDAAAVWVYGSCLQYAAWAAASASTSEIYTAVARDDDEAAAREAQFEAATKSKKAVQVALLRCVFGNPFRPINFDPAWRTPAVLALATAAYDNRTLPAGTLEPDCLAVLTDALEEIGCDNGELLGHLREDGPHVRGCWCVDLILSRQ